MQFWFGDVVALGVRVFHAVVTAALADAEQGVAQERLATQKRLAPALKPGQPFAWRARSGAVLLSRSELFP